MKNPETQFANALQEAREAIQIVRKRGPRSLGDSPEAQADAIVERLFVNGFGDRADRLVLEGLGKRDLGGWCRGAVRDVILDVLRCGS